MDIGERGVFVVERETRPVAGCAGKEGAVLGGARKGCMRVFDDICVCIGFEDGVSEGCGVALCLRDTSVWPCSIDTSKPVV
jgi:hypothetical protein